MELWDLYNKDRELIGKTHVRGEAIPEGCFHLVVHVWIRNKHGEYLISQRSANRPTFPLMWECVGGSVTAGEDSLAGALREVFEEVGIELNPTSGRVVFSRVRDVIGGKRFGDIMDVWLFDFDGDADLDTATTDEVADARWMRVEEIRTLYEEGKLVHTLDYFFTEFNE